MTFNSLDIFSLVDRLAKIDFEVLSHRGNVRTGDPKL